MVIEGETTAPHKQVMIARILADLSPDVNVKIMKGIISQMYTQN